MKFHWQVDHATKYKSNLVRYLWELCYAPHYAEIANEIILSREKEMSMMGTFNPIMYRWGGWREKVTQNFKGRFFPRVGRVHPDDDNHRVETLILEMENGREYALTGESAV